MQIKKFTTKQYIGLAVFLLGIFSLMMVVSKLFANKGRVPMAQVKEKTIAPSKLTPLLMVEDVSKAVEFYEGILGFKKTMTVPDAPPFIFGAVQAGNVEIMFQQREALVKDLPMMKDRGIKDSTFLYMDIEGIEDFYRRVKIRTEIVKDLHKTFYGMREFYITDQDGHILGFAEKTSDSQEEGT
ncbi:MAG: VOC family protein [Elusimicrobia bacterium]|nr:VOC family protein [Elusimicrobiota bacterium]